MRPNNDDILSIILESQGRRVSTADVESVASDPQTSQAYRELAAIVKLASSNTPSEHEWRDRAIRNAVERAKSGAKPAFRSKKAARPRYAFALAAAVVVCAAVGLWAASAGLQDAGQNSAPVISLKPQPQSPYQIAAAPQTVIDPAQSIAAAINSAQAGSTIEIPALNSAEKLRVSKPITLHAVGGTVRIGAGH